MKCLVTGNHGYIGFVLSDELLKNGHEVVGYDCDYFPLESFGRPDVFKSKEKITQIRKDIRDVSKEDMTGVDAVIHLAALPNDPACDINPKFADQINHVATVNLAKTAKSAGVKTFIFGSSCSVFGAKGDEMINEKDKPAPITPYGVSKQNAEQELLKLNSGSFTVACMRNATCYGVSPRMRFDMVLNNLVGYAYTEGKVKILSDGTSWRPIVHIEDVSRAYLLALDADKDKISGQIFAVGTENFQVKAIASIVESTVPKSKTEYSPNGQKDLRSYRVSFDKLKETLGFKPKWSAKDGAKELYNAYKSYGLTKESFQDSKFWAGKYFKYLIESKSVDENLKIA